MPERIDSELGPEKLCEGCGEWWPLDDEFWYFREYRPGQRATRDGRPYTRARHGRYVQAPCRACWTERRKRYPRGERISA